MHQLPALQSAHVGSTPYWLVFDDFSFFLYSLGYVEFLYFASYLHPMFGTSLDTFCNRCWWTVWNYDDSAIA
jgi:hypothetical protein